jgi:hypothetical protein
MPIAFPADEPPAPIPQDFDSTGEVKPVASEQPKPAEGEPK